MVQRETLPRKKNGGKRQTKSDRQCVGLLILFMVKSVSILDRTLCKDPKFHKGEDAAVRKPLKRKLFKLTGTPSAEALKEQHWQDCAESMDEPSLNIEKIVADCLEGEDQEVVSTMHIMVQGTMKYGLFPFLCHHAVCFRFGRAHLVPQMWADPGGHGVVVQKRSSVDNILFVCIAILRATSFLESQN